MKEVHKRTVLKLISRPEYYKRLRNIDLTLRRDMDRCLIECIIILTTIWKPFNDSYYTQRVSSIANFHRRHPNFNLQFNKNETVVRSESELAFWLILLDKQTLDFRFMPE